MKKNIFILIAFVLLLSSPAFAKSLEATYQSAEEAFSAGKFQRAIRLYEDVVEMNPDFAPAYNGLGLAHKAINTDLSQVAWLFKTATEINPKYVQAYDNLCKIYYNMGEHDKAEEACLEALKLYPKLVSAQLSLGWIYLIGKSDPSKAAFYFNEVIKNNKIPYAYFGLGMAHFMNDDRPQVLETITALRGMGEDKLALQLEGISRQQRYAKAPESFLPPEALPKKQPGMIVGAKGEQMASAEEAPDPTKAVSSMRVRLRGRMSGKAPEEGATQATALPSEEASVQSRIEKVKAMRGAHQGNRPSSQEASQRLQTFQQRGY